MRASNDKSPLSILRKKKRVPETPQRKETHLNSDSVLFIGTLQALRPPAIAVPAPTCGTCSEKPTALSLSCTFSDMFVAVGTSYVHWPESESHEVLNEETNCPKKSKGFVLRTRKRWQPTFDVRNDSSL